MERPIMIKLQKNYYRENPKVFAKGLNVSARELVH